jgi:hypothetical protein
VNVEGSAFSSIEMLDSEGIFQIYAFSAERPAIILPRAFEAPSSVFGTDRCGSGHDLNADEEGLANPTSKSNSIKWILTSTPDKTASWKLGIQNY